MQPKDSEETVRMVADTLPHITLACHIGVFLASSLHSLASGVETTLAPTLAFRAEVHATACCWEP